MRSRPPDTMRPVLIQTGYQQNPEGSALVCYGNTRVIVAASVLDRTPPWLSGAGLGWVTAEYDMLPRATNTRSERNPRKSRSREISRVLGRALRAVVNRKLFPGFTVALDADVLDADGGTRVAAATGCSVALSLAFRFMEEQGVISDNPLSEPVAGVSVGVVDGEPRLDLDYDEDSRAETDCNLFLTGSGRIVELQATAEREPLGRETLDALIDLAQKGADEAVFPAMREALSGG